MVCQSTSLQPQRLTLIDRRSVTDTDSNDCRLRPYSACRRFGHRGWRFHRWTLIVTNTGNSVDVFSLLLLVWIVAESSVLLQPRASSLELPWSCEVPDDALAGTNAFSFRAVSSARSDALQNEVVVYTIEATWDASSVVAISIDDRTLSIPYLEVLPPPSP